MATHIPVPSDTEAESILSLVHDCREITGVLGSFSPAEIHLPVARSAPPLEISLDAVDALAGYDDYGS